MYISWYYGEIMENSIAHKENKSPVLRKTNPVPTTHVTGKHVYNIDIIAQT